MEKLKYGNSVIIFASYFHPDFAFQGWMHRPEATLIIAQCRKL